MAYKTVDSSAVSFYNMIESIAKKFEEDLLATGRFKYVRTDGNRKIYVEIATGREVPVLMPKMTQYNTGKRT